MGPLTIPGMSQLPFPTSYFSSTPTKHPPYGLSEEGKSLMNNWAPFNPTSGRGYLSKKKHASANLTLSKFWKKQRRPHPRRLVGPKKISAVHWRTSLRWFFALGRWPKRQGKNTGFPKWSSNGSSRWKIANLVTVGFVLFFGGVDEESDLGCSKKGHLRTGNLKHLDKDPLQCWLLCLYYSCT